MFPKAKDDGCPFETHENKESKDLPEAEKKQKTTDFIKLHHTASRKLHKHSLRDRTKVGAQQCFRLPDRSHYCAIASKWQVVIMWHECSQWFEVGNEMCNGYMFPSEVKPDTALKKANIQHIVKCWSKEFLQIKKSSIIQCWTHSHTSHRALYLVARWWSHSELAPLLVFPQT